MIKLKIFFAAGFCNTHTKKKKCILTIKFLCQCIFILFIWVCGKFRFSYFIFIIFLHRRVVCGIDSFLFSVHSLHLHIMKRKIVLALHLNVLNRGFRCHMQRHKLFFTTLNIYFNGTIFFCLFASLCVYMHVNMWWNKSTKAHKSLWYGSKQNKKNINIFMKDLIKLLRPRKKSNNFDVCCNILNTKVWTESLIDKFN